MRLSKQKLLNKRVRTISAILFVVVFCSIIPHCNDYNPFEDPGNSRAVVSTTFGNRDTLSIFSTETLQVLLSVPSLIGQFSVSVTKNRFFADTAVLSGQSGTLLAGPHPFKISFYDTGWQSVHISVLRKNGDVIHEPPINVYVTSPLNQQPLAGFLGDSISLKTDPVKDRDVIYQWSFGKSVVIESVPPETRQIVRTTGTAIWGELWVTDMTKKNVSPKTGFRFTLRDETGPEIICVNDALRNDTIWTGEKTFYFRAAIIDRGTGDIYHLEVNGTQFDIMRSPLFVKRVEIADTTRPQRITVTASDIFLNTTEKSFWLVYSPLHAAAPAKPILKFIIPHRDNITTGNREWTILGTIENFAADSLDVDVKISVNDSTYSDTRRILARYSGSWEFRISLPRAINVVAVTAYDRAGTIVASDQTTLLYQSDFIDQTPPIIAEVTADRREIDQLSGLMQERDSVLLRVIAFDEGSGIEHLWINDSILAPSTQSQGYIWEKHVHAAHRAGGSPYRIRVRDVAGFSRDTVVVISQNRAPVIMRMPTPPLPLLTGQPYREGISAIDPDGDLLTYTINGPGAMIIGSQSGKISWMPQLSDIGIHQITIRIEDQFTTVPLSYAIRVVDPLHLPDRITFYTQTSDFPSVLEALKDTLRMQLAVMDGTGRPPLHFSLWSRNSSSIAVNDSSGVLQWVPALVDTGIQNFLVIVSDTFKTADTLYPSILVVPPNRAFVLSETWTGKTLPDGSLDLSGGFKPETLSIFIDDPDDPAAERLTAQVTRLGSLSFPDAQSRIITIVTDPQEIAYGVDTITIRVSDRAAHTREIRKIAYYGSRPLQAQAIAPLSGLLVRDSMVQLKWQCSDPDENPLRYTVYLGLNGVLKPVAVDISATSFTAGPLNTAGRYYWRIESRDLKSASQIELFAFSIDPPLRLKLSTTGKDFPSFLEANHDTLRKIVALIAETGVKPFGYSVKADSDSVQPYFTGDTLFWAPSLADTGLRQIEFVMHDAIGNADTLKIPIRVVPPNRPCSLSVSYTGVLTADSAIDLSASVSATAITILINDPDLHEIESYTVSIRQSHVETIEKADTSRTISLVIDPMRAIGIRDTIRVIVTDRGGESDTANIVVHYGAPPHIPSNPRPAQSSIVRDSLVTLSWTGGDPDGNPVTYDVYFGTNLQRTKISSGLSKDSLNVTGLKADSAYYWQIVAHDARSSSEGPVWHFSTQGSGLRKIYLNTGSDGVSITANIANFPVLVRLDSANINFAIYSSDGHEVRFRKADGTPLPYEIESWNGATKSAAIWVLVDQIAAGSSSQYIEMWLDTLAVVSESNPAAVFSSANGFAGVWHMSGATIGSAGVRDATPFANHGTLTNMDVSNAVDGIAAQSLSFDGQSEYIDIGNTASLGLSGPFTIEAWVKMSSASLELSGYSPILAKGNSTYQLQLNNGTGRVQCFAYDNTFPNWHVASANIRYIIDTWYHVTGLYTSDSVYLYVNGVQQNHISSASFLAANSYAFQIGHDAEYTNRYFRGIIDEARVSRIARSSSWIKLSYENQRIGSNFVRIE